LAIDYEVSTYEHEVSTSGCGEYFIGTDPDIVEKSSLIFAIDSLYSLDSLISEQDTVFFRFYTNDSLINFSLLSIEDELDWQSDTIFTDYLPLNTTFITQSVFSYNDTLLGIGEVIYNLNDTYYLDEETDSTIIKFNNQYFLIETMDSLQQIYTGDNYTPEICVARGMQDTVEVIGMIRKRGMILEGQNMYESDSLVLFQGETNRRFVLKSDFVFSDEFQMNNSDILYAAVSVTVDSTMNRFSDELELGLFRILDDSMEIPHNVEFGSITFSNNSILGDKLTFKLHDSHFPMIYEFITGESEHFGFELRGYSEGCGFSAVRLLPDVQLRIIRAVYK